MSALQIAVLLAGGHLGVLVNNNQQISELAAILGDKLSARQQWVTVAESCTGGGVAEAITRIPGSSGWFELGFVTYSNRAKTRLLGVDEGVLATVGAVSRPVVESMAEGALLESQADMAVAISGIAGPDGGNDDKPVGTVWFAWALDSGLIEAEVHHFDGDRAAVRQQSVIVALQGLLDRI